MRKEKFIALLLALNLTAALSLVPAASAQRRRIRQPAPVSPNAPAKPLPAQGGETAPAPAAAAARPAEQDRPVEELLASDSYAVIIEVRDVGQLVENEVVKSALATFRLMGDVPPEVNETLAFLSANSEVLADAKFVVATMPGNKDLPMGLTALQLSSVEGARAFEPKLRAFVNKQLRSAALVAEVQPPSQPQRRRRGGRNAPAPPPPPQSNLLLKRYGSVFVASDVPVTLKQLRGDGSDLLANNARFQTFKSRLSSDPLFVYVDTTIFRQGLNVVMEQAKEAEAANQIEIEIPDAEDPTAERDADAELDSDDTAREAPAPDLPLTDLTPPGLTDEEKDALGEDKAEVSSSPVLERDPASALFSLAYGGLFGGAPRIPDNIGLGVSLSADALTARALVANEPGVPFNIIPLIPNVIAGPEFAPDSPSLAPADTQIFASGSVDWEQILNGLLRDAEAARIAQVADGREVEREATAENASASEDTLKSFEAALGIKVKEDLLPLLGYEVAITAPLSWFGFTEKKQAKSPDGEKPKEEEALSKPGFVLLVSLNDREKARAILPRLLANVGLPGATAQMLAEKRGGFEIQNLGGLAFVFVNNFVAVAENVEAARHFVDSYASQQTLASHVGFNEATSWKPRQRLAQVYVSDALVRSWLEEIKQRASASTDPVINAMMAVLDVKPEAATYAATSEGDAVLHELHLPMGLLQTMVAGIAVDAKEGPITNGEAMATIALRQIAIAQGGFKDELKKGRYGTLQELMAEKLLEREFVHMAEEYKFEVQPMGDQYVALATPLKYGQTGRRSFFMDQTGTIRGADHKGRPATAADPPID